MLEHVTREITVEALPTEIPERLVADVSAMEINDTLQLSTSPPPTGVNFVADDPEEVTIATLSPPRVEEEPEPEVEEETELVGEEGEAPEGEEGRGRGGARGRGRVAEGEGSGLRRGVALSLLPPPRADRPTASGGDRILIVGLGNPGAALRAAPATTSASRSAPSSRGAGTCRGRRSVRRPDRRRPRRPGRPAGRDPAAADLHERVRRLGRARRAARSRCRSTGSSSSTTRSTSRSARSSQLGGGLAGHNGLKSLKRGFGEPDFWRVRVGVGRPDSTDPEIVSAYVLGRFREPRERGRRR